MSFSIFHSQPRPDPEGAGILRRLRAARDSLLNVTLTGGGPIRRLPFGRASAHDRLEEQCVLITGASSGIGRALALTLAEHRVRLVLVARSAPQLHDLQAEIVALGGQARVYVADWMLLPPRKQRDSMNRRWCRGCRHTTANLSPTLLARVDRSGNNLQPCDAGAH
jgi:hypothetical protein